MRLLRKRSKRQQVVCFGYYRAIRRAKISASSRHARATTTSELFRRRLSRNIQISRFPVLPTNARAEFLWSGATGLLSSRAGRLTTHGRCLARVLSWSKNRGKITVNPCERGGRIYSGSRAENVWSADQEAAFLKSAPEHLHLPLLLTLWTGQRQGDLLRLPWSAYNGTQIRLRQSKTGARVVVPLGAPLKAAMDAAAKRSTIILTTADGKPWTAAGFRASWRNACTKAGVSGVTFNDLRGTAVTRLALAECTEAEIATITGHSLRDVRSILDAHYLHRDPALAESAIRKLEKRTETSK